MAFNNDVSVGEVFNRFYQQVMGKEKPKVSEIEIFLLSWTGSGNFGIL